MSMQSCKRCTSHAINPHLHGREEGVDLDLCDVCYWRKRAERKCSELNDKTQYKFGDTSRPHVPLFGGKP